MMKDIEPWERAYMRKYVLAFSLSGMAGMIVTGLMIWWLFGTGQGGTGLGLLCLPWAIVGSLLVPAAFHKGAELQRQRQAE
jgi:hypothetical protein